MFEEEGFRPPNPPQDDNCSITDQCQLLKVDYNVKFCVEIEECDIIEVISINEDEF